MVDKLNEADIVTMFANPFYTVQLGAGWEARHTPLIDQETWIAANTVLIDELGRDEWLRQLLDNLRRDVVPVDPEARTLS